MNRIHSPLVLLGVSAAGLALACSGMTAPAPGATLTLDASSYIAVAQAPVGTPSMFRFTVVARFRNDGSTDAHLAKCSPGSGHPVFDVALKSPGTLSGYDPVWTCVGTDPIVVAPGETRTDTLVIVGPTIIDGRTNQPVGQLEGIFQLRYVGDVCNAPNACQSQLFTVRIGK
ncbi:MAG TPA: hypothetical protein VIC03_00035 [Gemmatimonadaceae bacterium]|jgi:hypothetical protein